jgi:hypothetical protein
MYTESQQVVRMLTMIAVLICVQEFDKFVTEIRNECRGHYM